MNSSALGGFVLAAMGRIDPPVLDPITGARYCNTA